MIFILLIYVLNCILNYHGNNDFGTNQNNKLFVIFAGFFCTPAAVVILISFIISPTWDILFFGKKHFRGVWVFSGIVNIGLGLYFLLKYL